jgi:hypothetical protein
MPIFTKRNALLGWIVFQWLKRRQRRRVAHALDSIGRRSAIGRRGF